MSAGWGIYEEMLNSGGWVVDYPSQIIGCVSEGVLCFLIRESDEGECE